MASDATGTPTTKGIPKYDPANDAPSGLGFNAAMDAIDALLGWVKVRKNSTGSVFSRSRVNFIEGSGVTITVADDSPDNEVDVTIAAASQSVGYGTALPGSPADGDEFVLVDSTSAPTYAWRFRYNAGSGSAHKWEFVGGSPAFAEVATSEQTSSTSYVALSTAGPSFALPVAGDYLVEIGFAQISPAAADRGGLMSYDIGGTGAVDADAAYGQTNTGSTSKRNSVFRPRKKTGLTAVTLTAKYRSSAAEADNFSERWMRVTPIRVG